MPTAASSNEASSNATISSNLADNSNLVGNATKCDFCSQSGATADPDVQACILHWLALLMHSPGVNSTISSEFKEDSLSLNDLADGAVLVNLVSRIDPDWRASDNYEPLDSALPRFAFLEEYLDSAFGVARYALVRVLDWDRIVLPEAAVGQRDWELLKVCVLLLAAWLRQARTLELAAAAADTLPAHLQPRAVASLRPLLSLPEGAALSCDLFHCLLATDFGSDELKTDANQSMFKSTTVEAATADHLDTSAAKADNGRDAETAAYWLNVRLRTSEMARFRLEARVADLECQAARYTDSTDELRAALEDAQSDARRSKRRAVEATRAAETATAENRRREAELEACRARLTETSAAAAEASAKAAKLQSEVDSLTIRFEEATRLLNMAKQRETATAEQMSELREELGHCRCGSRAPGCSHIGLEANLGPELIHRSVEACCIEPPRPVCQNKKVQVRSACVDKQVGVCLDPPEPVYVNKEVEVCLESPKPVCVSREVEACIEPPKPVCLNKKIGVCAELVTDQMKGIEVGVQTSPDSFISRPAAARASSGAVERDVEDSSAHEEPLTFSVKSPSQALLQIGRQVEARLDQTFSRLSATVANNTDKHERFDENDGTDEDVDDEELLSELNLRRPESQFAGGSSGRPSLNNFDHNCSFRVGGARRLSATADAAASVPAKILDDDEELQLPITTSSLLDALTLERCKRELDLAKATNSALVARIDDLSSQLSRSRQQYQQLAVAAANRRWSPVFPRQQQQLHQRRRSHTRTSNQCRQDEFEDSIFLDDQLPVIGGVPTLAEEEAAAWRAAERRQRLAKRRRASLHNLAAWMHPPQPSSPAMLPPPPPPPPPPQPLPPTSEHEQLSANRIASWLATPGRRLKRIGAAGRRFRASVGSWDVS